MKLFVATHNAHKIREISQILPDFEIVPDDPEGIEENAPDFIGNAFIKVRAIAARHPGEWCMADDSGLEVKALGGAPGVRSARYAGVPSSTPANNALLLKNLDGVEDRTANFTCAIALVDPEGREHTAFGKCFGKIALAPSGAEGFGYDPLFLPDGHDKSFAELTADEKNAISHRGRALAEARRLLGAVRKSKDVKCRLLPWLKLFRVVNLPTVPGDVLVGAATATGCAASLSESLPQVWWAVGASVLIYMFGLAHNDILGAKKDRDRPIPDGDISTDAAWVAAVACLVVAFGCAYAGGLFAGGWKVGWPSIAITLVATVALYNRMKYWWLMGLCRALNVLLGAAAVGGLGLRAASVGVLWWLYISVVTIYSSGEESDPAKRRRVGLLVGGIVYLQLAALIAIVLKDARSMPLLVAGATLLVALRVFKQVFPSVSAS